MAEHPFELEQLMQGRGSPGLILGPYEALVAQALYTLEVAGDARKSGSAREWFRSRLRISPDVKNQILAAYLLFGKLDALACGGLLNGFFASHGTRFSAREFFGDFDWRSYVSPFSHEMERLSFPIHFDRGDTTPAVVSNSRHWRSSEGYEICRVCADANLGWRYIFHRPNRR